MGAPEDPQSPADVVLVAGQGIGHAPRHAGQGRLVEDTVHSFAALFDRFEFGDRTLDEGQPVQDIVQVFPPSGGQVVQHDHLVPRLNQMATQVRPDETGSPGYQISAHVPENPPVRGGEIKA